jgi:hypothetical protein
MSYRRSLVCSVLFLSCLVAVAKDKKKAPLPFDVLQAHSVWVIVDPTVGVDVTDPNANRNARADVEKALAKWGRLTPVADGSVADLIITVRKGNGKLAQTTIGGTPINGPPPVVAQRTDSGISASTRIGPQPQSSDPYPQSSGPHPQMEIGSTQDMFVVYRGDPNHDNTTDPLDSPPVWRYTAKDALASPGVPAVDAFRKAVNDSEKALAGP